MKCYSILAPVLAAVLIGTADSSAAEHKLKFDSKQNSAAKSGKADKTAPKSSGNTDQATPKKMKLAGSGVSSVVVRDIAWDAEMNQRAAAMGCQVINGDGDAGSVEQEDVPESRIAHHGAVSLLAVAPDGAYAYSVSADDGNVAKGKDRNFRIRRWNVATGEIDRDWVAHQEPIHSLQATNDGKRLVSAADDGLAKVWRLPEGDLEKTVKVFDVAAFRELAQRQRVKDFRPPSWKALLGRTPDELLVCGEESTRGYGPGLGIWSIETRECRERIFYRHRIDAGGEGDKYAPHSVALSPNGQLLAVSCTTFPASKIFLNPLDHKYLEALKPTPPSPIKTLVVWPEKNQQTIPVERAGAMVFSPDGKLLATAWEKGLSIWSMPDRGFVWHLTPDETGWITAMAMSFDGEQILTGNHAGFIRAWSARDGRLIKESRLGQAPVTAITPVADGRGYLIGSGFGHVVFWCQYKHIIVRYFHDVEVESIREKYVYVYKSIGAADKRTSLKSVTRWEEIPTDGQNIKLIPKELAEEWIQRESTRRSDGGGSGGGIYTYTYTITIPY